MTLEAGDSLYHSQPGVLPARIETYPKRRRRRAPDRLSTEPSNATLRLSRPEQTPAVATAPQEPTYEDFLAEPTPAEDVG